VLLASSSVAAPSQQAGSLSGASLPSQIAISDDYRYVAVSEKAGSGLALWDTWALSLGPALANTCVPAAAIEFASNLATADRFYVACENGEVYYVDVDGSSIPPTLTVSASIQVNGGSGDVLDLAWAPGDDYVHALVHDAGYMSLHRISMSQDTATSVVAPRVVGGNPVGLAIGATGTPLVVPRSDGYLSWIDRSGDSYSPSNSDVLVSFGGVLSSAAVSTDYGLVYVTDSGQSTLWTMPVAAPGQSTALVSNLAGAGVVALRDEGGELLAYGAGTGTTIDVYDSLGALDASIDLVDSSPVSIALADDASAAVWVAAADGSVRLLSDLPFIESLSASTSSVTTGDDFSLSFSANEDGPWDVRIGGDGVPGSGSSVAGGALVAGAVTVVDLGASDLLVEGANRLFVFVTGVAGVAVDSVAVILDQPPGSVDDLTLLSGDSRVVADWTAGSETDLAHYTLYLSDLPFAPDDATLPGFSTESDGVTLTYPLSVTAGQAGTGHSLEIEGLSNGTSYYVAVQAVDGGGLVGPVSGVVSATPEATCGAAECAGDNYGCSCSGGSSLVGSVDPSPGFALLALLGALLRRRQSL
jgi:hypothetical protein